MTEAELEKLLSAARRRLRWMQGLRAALAAMGVALLLATGVVLAVRLGRGAAVWTGLSLAGVGVATFVSGWVALYRYRPLASEAAWLLDRRGKTGEQLVTWLELRASPDAALNPLERDFKAAQRDLTLRNAAGLSLKKLLPWVFPEWSRMLWLALLLWCCACLMPEAAPLQSVAMASIRGEKSESSPAANNWAGRPQTNFPGVQILSPTELCRMKLVATDSDMPTGQKLAVLKELLSKVGLTPENELTPEVRELLDLLRQETHQVDGQTAGSEAAPKPNAGASSSHVGAHADEGGIPKSLESARLPATFEKVWTQWNGQYPDVREVLTRYYQPAQESRAK